MNEEYIERLLEKIRVEKSEAKQETYSAEGLMRLQEAAKLYAGEYRLIWSDALLDELKTKPKQLSHPTGINALDAILGGFRPQQLVTLSAHSKHGKTAFGMFLMEQLEDLKPLMVPLEQSNEELVEQRSSNGYSIPKFLSPRKLASRVTVDWIEERVVEGIAKYNTKLVVIDHLGYIDDFGRYARENLAYRIQVLMQGLKTIAKRWNVTVVLLVHIVQADEGKPPSLQDLKGSSAILQESDTVIMLWRKNEMRKKVRIYEDKTMVSVLANRRTGKNGSIGMRFDTKTGRYVEELGWVESMMKIAEEDIRTDDDF